MPGCGRLLSVAVLLGVALAAAVCLSLRLRSGSVPTEGFSATDNAAGLLNTQAESARDSELAKYSCNLHAAPSGGATCTVSFEETPVTEGDDMKCNPIRQAMNAERGSYVRTYRYLLDEGRLRTVDDDPMSCDLLPTDTMMYPGSSQHPVCSKENPNLYDEEKHPPGVVSISENKELGRCRLTFSEDAEDSAIVLYSAYLDVRARLADVEANKSNLRELCDMVE